MCRGPSTGAAVPRAAGRPREISRLPSHPRSTRSRSLPAVARDDQYWRGRSSPFRIHVMSTGGPTAGGPEWRHLHGDSTSGRFRQDRGGVSTPRCFARHDQGSNGEAALPSENPSCRPTPRPDRGEVETPPRAGRHQLFSARRKRSLDSLRSLEMTSIGGGRSSPFRIHVMSTGGPTAGGPERRHLHGNSAPRRVQRGL